MLQHVVSFYYYATPQQRLVDMLVSGHCMNAHVPIRAGRPFSSLQAELANVMYE